MSRRSFSVEDVKKFIEEKYRQLEEPLVEYMPVEVIKEVFLPYVRNPQEFLALKDEEIVKFYNEWYKKNVIPLKQSGELEGPDMD